MARIVQSFDDDLGTRRYPWHEWTDGNIWEIMKGEDYVVATENMRVNLHERARQHGLSVKTQKVRNPSEGLRFQFRTKPSGPKPLTAGIRDMQF